MEKMAERLSSTSPKPDRGYPSGTPGTAGQGERVGVPLQLAAKCCREAARHLERDKGCAKYVIDGDGLATGGKA